MECRPFGELARADEPPDRLPLDVQSDTDGLLTHALAVQFNHFVIPVNPTLAPILTILFKPALGLRNPISRWRRRFGHRGHNRLRQGGAFLLQDPLHGGGQVTEQMKTVGYLDSLRGATGGAVGIDPSPITTYYLRAGMHMQPSSQGIGGTIWQ